MMISLSLSLSHTHKIEDPPSIKTTTNGPMNTPPPPLHNQNDELFKSFLNFIQTAHQTQDPTSSSKSNTTDTNAIAIGNGIPSEPSAKRAKLGDSGGYQNSASSRQTDFSQKSSSSTLSSSDEAGQATPVAPNLIEYFGFNDVQVEYRTLLNFVDTKMGNALVEYETALASTKPWAQKSSDYIQHFQQPLNRIPVLLTELDLCFMRRSIETQLSNISHCDFVFDSVVHFVSFLVACEGIPVQVCTNDEVHGDNKDDVSNLVFEEKKRVIEEALNINEKKANHVGTMVLNKYFGQLHHFINNVPQTTK